MIESVEIAVAIAAGGLAAMSVVAGFLGWLMRREAARFKADMLVSTREAAREEIKATVNGQITRVHKAVEGIDGQLTEWRIEVESRLARGSARMDEHGRAIARLDAEWRLPQ